MTSTHRAFLFYILVLSGVCFISTPVLANRIISSQEQCLAYIKELEVGYEDLMSKLRSVNSEQHVANDACNRFSGGSLPWAKCMEAFSKAYDEKRLAVENDMKANLAERRRLNCYQFARQKEIEAEYNNRQSERRNSPSPSTSPGYDPRIDEIKRRAEARLETQRRQNEFNIELLKKEEAARARIEEERNRRVQRGIEAGRVVIQSSRELVDGVIDSADMGRTGRVKRNQELDRYNNQLGSEQDHYLKEKKFEGELLSNLERKWSGSQGYESQSSKIVKALSNLDSTPSFSSAEGFDLDQIGIFCEKKEYLALLNKFGFCFDGNKYNCIDHKGIELNIKKYGYLNRQSNNSDCF